MLRCCCIPRHPPPPFAAISRVASCACTHALRCPRCFSPQTAAAAVRTRRVAAAAVAAAVTFSSAAALSDGGFGVPLMPRDFAADIDGMLELRERRAAVPALGGMLPQPCPLPATPAAFFDHTLLRPDATAADIRQLCVEAARFGFKSVCVNASWASLARATLDGLGSDVEVRPTPLSLSLPCACRDAAAATATATARMLAGRACGVSSAARGGFAAMGVVFVRASQP